MATTTVLIGHNGGGTGSFSIPSAGSYNQVAGHAIVVILCGFNEASATISDTAGNSWYLFYNGILVGGDFAHIWVATNCKGNATNVISVVGSHVFDAVFAWDVAGADQSFPLDVITTTTGAATPSQSSAFSTNYANESLIGFNFISSGYSTASSPTFGGVAATLDGNDGGGGNQGAGSHLDVSAIQSGITSNFTLSPSTAWGAFVLSLLAPTNNQFVQSANHVDNAGTAVYQYQLAYPNACNTNDLLFVTCGWKGNDTTPTISDTYGNTWVALPYQNNTFNLQSWYCLSCKAGSGTNTVTVSWGSSNVNSTYGALCIDEWSCPANYGFRLDQHGENTTHAAITLSGLKGQGDVVFGYGGIYNYTSFVGDIRWRLRSYGPASATMYLEDTKPAINSITFTPQASVQCAGVAAFYSTSMGVPNSLMLMGCGI
jgi:hypothetical protein